MTTSRASCDAKNKPCLQSSSLPFFSRSRGLVNRVCLAPVSLLSDCFLTRGSCTYTRQRCVQRTLAGRVWLVQAPDCLPPSSLQQSQTLPRSLKPEVSPAFEGRVLFQLLSTLSDLKNYRLWSFVSDVMPSTRIHLVSLQNHEASFQREIVGAI